MSPETVFVVVCPACKSSSSRNVSYLGLPVRCRKCKRNFQAVDLHAESDSARDPVGVWLMYSTSHEFQDSPRNPSPR